MQASPPATRRFSVDEVLRMVEAGILAPEEPYELLDGRLVAMTPQGPAHAGIVANLADRLRAAYAADPRVVVREEKPLIAGELSLPEPDVALVRMARHEMLRRHPRGDEALLVAETAVSSQKQDREKAATYARAGVPVYWLLDVTARRIEVHEAPQASGSYARVRVLSGDDALTLPGLQATWPAASLFG